MLYLGSASGLMAVNLATSAINTYNVNGTVVAITPDGKYLLISDSVANNIYYFSVRHPRRPLYPVRQHDKFERLHA